MKIFGFIKNSFILCVVFQQTIKSVKQDHKLIMLMEMNLCFFHLVLKHVNVAVVVIILTIRMVCKNLCS